MIIKSVLLLLLFSLALQAKHLHKEKVYQEHFCKAFGGVAEHILPDRTRVDCLLDTYAIEVDFAQKWAESIGQSLYYASQATRSVGISLSPAGVFRGALKIEQNQDLTAYWNNKCFKNLTITVKEKAC
ncbi:MAG: hypothetical protein IBX43_04500 [Campylobacterales bacterium]|nr:hypothetical protein [Campylobacterales bacterium]